MRLAVTAAAPLMASTSERGMVDVFAYDIVEAFRQRGCPLCRALSEFEAIAMETFLREGHRPNEVRVRFVAGGGFCRQHAWLLHRLAVEHETPVPIAHVYTRLVNHDLDFMGRLEAEIAQTRKRRLSGRLRREASCLACQWAEESLRRKAAFLVDALDSGTLRAQYAESDGLCHAHLVAAVEEALEERPDVALFLLGDWRLRLERLAHDLAEYDRKRDVRYAQEPKGAEQESWTEVIRRYVGEDLAENRPR
jgi:hypothetical protein